VSGYRNLIFISNKQLYWVSMKRLSILQKKPEIKRYSVGFLLFLPSVNRCGLLI